MQETIKRLQIKRQIALQVEPNHRPVRLGLYDDVICIIANFIFYWNQWFKIGS